MSKTLPAIIVRELFDYRDGFIFWSARPLAFFRIERDCIAWNNRFAGKEAGTIQVSLKGVKRRKTAISLHGAKERYLNSRLVWAWHNREWPANLIDHEDGDTLNDKIGNLRDVPYSQNSKNMKMRAANTSGVTGVYFNKRLDKWVAAIMVDRAQLYLGLFDTIDEAANARKAADVKHGFHPNHGRSSHV
jgi:hypothetical protein